MALPNGYTQLEYIESTGTQYINTDVAAEYTLTADIAFVNTAARNLMGASSKAGYYFGVTAAGIYELGGSVTLALSGLERREITVVGTSSDISLTAEGQTITRAKSASDDSTLKLLGGVDGYPCAAKLYSCQIHVNGTLARDFVPAMYSNGVIGLYDQVGGGFYTNAGSGTFKAGPEIEIPAVHKTLVSNVGYEIIGGSARYNGVAYEIDYGRTLVKGAGYDIPFEDEPSILYTGQYVLYGDMEKGWIEMLTSGVLTLSTELPCDIYLLGKGSGGNSGYTYTNNSNQTYAYGGAGGAGGKYIELFEFAFRGEAIDVNIGSDTTLGAYSSANGATAASGGKGASMLVMSTSTTTAAGAGANGRQPFTNNNPMSDGFAALELGAGGGGGGCYWYSSSQLTQSGASGGTYGGGGGSSSGSGGSGATNTGSGGGGGASRTTYQESGSTTQTFNGAGGSGGSGIAIVRWGY